MGVGLAAAPTTASGQSSGFQPARHPQDDWFDQLPGKHRFFFDATSPTGAGDAITFASNYYTANKSGYGLEPNDLAVVICLRHWATPSTVRHCRSVSSSPTLNRNNRRR
jgi:hypothetical protein